jgi:hypothetical protein
MDATTMARAFQKTLAALGDLCHDLQIFQLHCRPAGRGSSNTSGAENCGHCQPSSANATQRVATCKCTGKQDNFRVDLCHNRNADIRDSVNATEIDKKSLTQRDCRHLRRKIAV